MSLLMRIVCLEGTGVPSEHEGRFVREYDPTVQTKDAGGVTRVYLVTTGDPNLAKNYSDLSELKEDWARRIGIRRDGKPDRPLTAFSIEPVDRDAAIAAHDPDPYGGHGDRGPPSTYPAPHDWDSMTLVERWRAEQEYWPPPRE